MKWKTLTRLMLMGYALVYVLWFFVGRASAAEIGISAAQVAGSGCEIAEPWKANDRGSGQDESYAGWDQGCLNSPGSHIGVAAWLGPTVVQEVWVLTESVHPVEFGIGFPGPESVFYRMDAGYGWNRIVLPAPRESTHFWVVTRTDEPDGAVKVFDMRAFSSETGEALPGVEKEEIPSDGTPIGGGGETPPGDGGTPGVVLIAPSGVTWDGLDVVIVQGGPVDVYYSFGAEPEKLACTAGVTGSTCIVHDDQHPGEVIRVRAVDAAGNEDSFEVYLARHVEPGRYFKQYLQTIIDLLTEIRDDLRSLVTITDEGFANLETAVNNLKNAGVFGQVNQSVDIITDTVDELTQVPPANTPGNYRPGVTGSIAEFYQPCEEGEAQKLTFCFPMTYGMEGVPGGQKTVYLRLDIPNHIRQYGDGYAELWGVIRVALWVGFLFWVVRQFVPQLTS